MEFRLLGPLEVREHERAVPLGGGKEAALLALLLLRSGETISIDRVIDALWGQKPPANAAKSVHVYVSHLRRALDDGRLVTRGRGYELQLKNDELDLHRFEALVIEGRQLRRQGNPREAAMALSDALSLWRGRPLTGLEYEEFASGEVERLEQLRLEAIEERHDARLELGEATALVSELEALVRVNPLRERLRGQLMLALYRSGRQAEALDVYQQGRRELAEELGLEPGRSLRELEQAILRQDRGLELAPQIESAAPALPSSPKRRAGLLLLLGGAVVLIAALATVALTRSGSARIVPVLPNSVAAIDPKTNRVVGDVRVGQQPGPIAVGQGSVWILNNRDHTVSHVDPATRTLEGTIPLDVIPSDLAVGAGSVWVVAPVGRLIRIDPNADRVRGEVSFGRPDTTGAGPEIAVGYGAIWIAAPGFLVIRVNPRTGSHTIVTESPTPNLDQAAIAVGAGAVWASYASNDRFLEIDPASSTVVDSITLPQGLSHDVAVGGGHVWATASGPNNISQIDPVSMALQHVTNVGTTPTDVAVGANAVWVVNQGDGTVSRLNLSSSRVEATIRVGGIPNSVTVGGGLVWVSVD